MTDEVLFFKVMHDITVYPNMLLEHGLVEEGSRYFMEVVALRRDVLTGQMGIGRGGQRFLPLDATESEIVQAAFAAMSSYTAHEDREVFEYKGVRVFGPHISIQAHLEAAGRTEPARPRQRFTDDMIRRQLERQAKKESQS